MKIQYIQHWRDQNKVPDQYKNAQGPIDISEEELMKLVDNFDVMIRKHSKVECYYIALDQKGYRFGQR